MGFANLFMVVSLVIGFQLPPQTGALDDNSSGDCTLDGTTYPVGSLTTADRCIRYRCINGDWKNPTINSTCGTCKSSSKKQENSSIMMYTDHAIGGVSKPSYLFDGSTGSYDFSQIGKPTSETEVIVTFAHTKENKTRITNVKYKEPGMTVEYVSPGPSQPAKILVNGKPKNPYGKMSPFNTTVGTTVYISHDSPSWPDLTKGGNIYIVGSQGLSVYIYALNGYAWFVYSYAMQYLEFGLFGLCDVFETDIPKNYTMRDGSKTTNLDQFFESWKAQMS